MARWILRFRGVAGGADIIDGFVLILVGNVPRCGRWFGCDGFWGFGSEAFGSWVGMLRCCFCGGLPADFGVVGGLI